MIKNLVCQLVTLFLYLSTVSFWQRIYAMEEIPGSCDHDHGNIFIEFASKVKKDKDPSATKVHELTSGNRRRIDNPKISGRSICADYTDQSSLTEILIRELKLNPFSVIQLELISAKGESSLVDLTGKIQTNCDQYLKSILVQDLDEKRFKECENFWSEIETESDQAKVRRIYLLIDFLMRKEKIEHVDLSNILAMASIPSSLPISVMKDLAEQNRGDPVGELLNIPWNLFGEDQEMRHAIAKMLSKNVNRPDDWNDLKWFSSPYRRDLIDLYAARRQQVPWADLKKKIGESQPMFLTLETILEHKNLAVPNDWKNLKWFTTAERRRLIDLYAARRMQVPWVELKNKIGDNELMRLALTRILELDLALPENLADLSFFNDVDKIQFISSYKKRNIKIPYAQLFSSNENSRAVLRELFDDYTEASEKDFTRAFEVQSDHQYKVVLFWLEENKSKDIQNIPWDELLNASSAKLLAWKTNKKLKASASKTKSGIKYISDKF